MSLDLLYMEDYSSGEEVAFSSAQHIEGLVSAIWTERYQDPGDFELRFADVQYGMNWCPPTGLLAVRESREIMQITSIEVEDTDDRGKELVVRGESYAHQLLKNRYIPYKVDANYNKKFKMPKQYYLDQVCCVLAWNSLRNPVVDSFSVLSNPDIININAFTVDDLLVSNSVTAGPGRPAAWLSRNRWLQAGPVYDKFMDFLVRGDMGVRTIRPSLREHFLYGNIRIVDVATGALTRGDYSHASPTAVQDDKMVFDIYKGYDLSVNNTQGNIPVAWSVSAGHLDDTAYLTDISDFYSIADVRSGWGNKFVYRSTWYAGAQLRALYVDGGAPDENENLNDFYNDLDQVGEMALKQHRRREAITTTVSQASPWKYGQHYGLGDRVTVLGEYGYVRDMIVTEFTRAWDDEGYREFPGLSMPNEL